MIEIDNKQYNAWRAEIFALYVFLTRRTYPSMQTRIRGDMIRRLIYLWDFCPNCTLFDAIDILVTEGILKS